MSAIRLRIRRILHRGPTWPSGRLLGDETPEQYAALDTFVARKREEARQQADH